MRRPPRLLFLQALTLFVLALAGCAARVIAAAPVDPLPSWNEGANKDAILAFVARVSTPGGPGFVPAAERIATFDNDGTLWPEVPVVQAAFTIGKVRAKVDRDPSLATQPAIKAALTGDLGYFTTAGQTAIDELLAITAANMTQEEFDTEARLFFQHAQHPTLKAPYTALAYRPMVELLNFLRANGFQNFICSGGGADFMRMVSQQMYGIPPQQVIGSRIDKQLDQKGGRLVIWRTARVASVNDKGGKVLNIDAEIGLRPLLAAGNVRSGGDIEMLEYAGAGARPSLELMIHHDDPVREFAYDEKNGASLAAAQAHDWNVVSMKHDWNVIFSR